MICAPWRSACFSKSRPIPQECGTKTELRALRDDGADGAADDGAANRPKQLSDLVLRGLARLRGPVPQNHVADLVRHHAGDFALGVRRLDHPAVDEHRSARQRERVDLAHVDRLERVLEFRMFQIGAGMTPPDGGRSVRHTTSPHRLCMIGSCLRASSAALRPSSTSCASVYLFLGGVIPVCALTSDPASATTTALASGWCHLGSRCFIGNCRARMSADAANNCQAALRLTQTVNPARSQIFN